MLERPRALKCATRGVELKQWSEWKYEVVNWLAVHDGVYRMEMQALEAQRSEVVAQVACVVWLVGGGGERTVVRIFRPCTDRTGYEA